MKPVPAFGSNLGRHTLSLLVAPSLRSKPGAQQTRRAANPAPGRSFHKMPNFCKYLWSRPLRARPQLRGRSPYAGSGRFSGRFPVPERAVPARKGCANLSGPARDPRPCHCRQKQGRPEQAGQQPRPGVRRHAEMRGKDVRPVRSATGSPGRTGAAVRQDRPRIPAHCSSPHLDLPQVEQAMGTPMPKESHTGSRRKPAPQPQAYMTAATAQAERAIQG